MRSSELSVPEYDEVFRDDDEEVSSKSYLSFNRLKDLTSMHIIAPAGEMVLTHDVVLSLLQPRLAKIIY
jgi:hypothetical protein